MTTNITINPPLPTTNENDLRAAGFTPGAPAQLKVLERNADWLTCREAACELCGQTGGLEYRPWHKGSAYRFLMTCPECGHSVEG